MKDSIKLNHYDIIRSTVLTEKSNLMTQYSQYFFDVSMDSDKKNIKEAVEAIFNVKVKAVNTLVRKGKTRVFRGRIGKRSDVKRAIVTLDSGHKIDLNAKV